MLFRFRSDPHSNERTATERLTATCAVGSRNRPAPMLMLRVPLPAEHVPLPHSRSSAGAETEVGHLNVRPGYAGLAAGDHTAGGPDCKDNSP